MRVFDLSPEMWNINWDGFQFSIPHYQLTEYSKLKLWTIWVSQPKTTCLIWKVKCFQKHMCFLASSVCFAHFSSRICSRIRRKWQIGVFKNLRSLLHFIISFDADVQFQKFTFFKSPDWAISNAPGLTSVAIDITVCELSLEMRNWDGFQFSIPHSQLAEPS